jgi:sugar phosphate isomerase/epimerase
MKICLYLQASDLISIKKTLLEKLNNFFIKDEKHDLFKKQSMDSVFQSLKKAGVDGLELIFPTIISNEDIEKIKKMTEKYNLPVFNIHQSNDSSFNISLVEIGELCKIANNFSAKVVVLHIDSLGKQLFDKNFITELKKLQRKHNLSFGIENMPKSPFCFSKPYTYKGKGFSDVVSETGLSITFDTTHLAQVGEDICEFYIANKKKIVNIHLSNYKISWLNKCLLLANDTHLPLNNGELPIIKFLQILKKEKYQGQITMEINARCEELCQNAELIRKNIS